jgi:hypothetical protein
MTEKQKAAAEFYAKATPRQARRRAMSGYRIPLSVLAHLVPEKPRKAKKARGR